MEAKDEHDPFIEISLLPDVSKAEMNFLDTSFFRFNGTSSLPRLPTPAEILQRYPNHSQGGVIKFEALSLAVKVGHISCVKLEEAQTMIAIRKMFPNGEVPVPEVYGWKRNGDTNYIYMSLIPGKTLGNVWPSLTNPEKVSICDELSRIVVSLRHVKQSTAHRFIGSINGGRIQDRYFQFDDEGGPLPTVKSFNDLFLAAATGQKYDRGTETIAGPYRELLPDMCNMHLTHGDLTLGNIMISGPPGARKVEAIIDWEQAGWYPEYWEYCKMLYGVNYEHDWHTKGWADTVMKPYQDEWWAFSEYFLWRGCP